MDHKLQKSTARTARNVDQQIDENLRRVYDEALNEELPDRFKDLLARLKSSTGDTTHGK